MTQTIAMKLDLFEGETEPRYGDSLQVEAVRALIKEITEAGEMTAAKQVLCATALKLAEIIEQPKSAIAAVQAAAQLTPLVERLTADSTEQAGMSEETKDLIRALTIDPTTYADTSDGNPAESFAP